MTYEDSASISHAIARTTRGPNAICGCYTPGLCAESSSTFWLGVNPLEVDVKGADIDESEQEVVAEASSDEVVFEEYTLINKIQSYRALPFFKHVPLHTLGVSRPSRTSGPFAGADAVGDAGGSSKDRAASGGAIAKSSNAEGNAGGTSKHCAASDGPIDNSNNADGNAGVGSESWAGSCDAADNTNTQW